MNDMFAMLWIERYRPKTLDDVILSDRNRRFFEEIRKKQEIPHLMFSGNPGIGKSVMARVLVEDILDCQYLYINASDESGVDVIRSKVTNFAQTGSLDGKLKVVILEEIDGLSAKAGSGSSAQQALRNVIEEYASNTRFVATCNYRSMIMDALDSRFQTLDLTPPYDKCVERAVSVLKAENVKVTDEQKKKLLHLVKTYFPDIRKIIGNLQKNTFGGELSISDESDRLDFATEVFKKLLGGDILGLRKFIIENEITFGNNYLSLLRNLFDVVYNSNLDVDTKCKMMLTISNSMTEHNESGDEEINAYSCLLALRELL